LGEEDGQDVTSGMGVWYYVLLNEASSSALAFGDISACANAGAYMRKGWRQNPAGTRTTSSDFSDS
jgi:hypothetical protein